MRLTESLSALFLRDLRGLRREVEAYPSEQSIWQALPGLSNSGGVLVRHLSGNLQHYLGAVLDGSGYLRDRANEFGGLPCSREQLLAEIAAAERAVAVVERLGTDQLDDPYPELLHDHQIETGDFLIHLVAHLAFHLGQVGYHRRAVTHDARSVGAGYSTELATARRD